MQICQPGFVFLCAQKTNRPMQILTRECVSEYAQQTAIFLAITIPTDVLRTVLLEVTQTTVQGFVLLYAPSSHKLMETLQLTHVYPCVLWVPTLIKLVRLVFLYAHSPLMQHTDRETLECVWHNAPGINLPMLKTIQEHVLLRVLYQQAHLAVISLKHVSPSALTFHSFMPITLAEDVSQYALTHQQEATHKT